MYSVIFARLLFITVSTLFFIFSAVLSKAPKKVVQKVLSVSWVTLSLVAFFDSLAVKLGFWHYRPDYLFFGLPVDVYIGASLIGVGFGIIYWSLKKKHHPFLTPFLVLVPILGFLNDWLGNMLFGNQLPIWDTPWWPVADLIIWSICWAVLLMVYKRVLRF